MVGTCYVVAMASTYHFDISSYNRIIEAGILSPKDKVELVCGEIINMSPMGDDHIFSVLSFTQRLTATYRDEALVLVQCPIQIPPDSEPEPDFALLRLPIDRYKTKKPQPEDILLIIEVSDSTLAYDSGKKLSLYAKALIPEVWVRNLPENTLEVYRKPKKELYSVHSIHFSNEAITPLFSKKAFFWENSSPAS